jgi:PAS domain S-box-containing protein
MILDQESIIRIKKALRFKSKGMSISEIASQLQMNRNSVAKYLEILSMNGEVEAKKLGTSKVYTVSQRVPISGWIRFSSDMIVIFNPEGQVLQVNDPFLRFCNLTDDEITGSDIRKIKNPLFRDIPLDHFINNDSGEKKTEYFEISLHSGDEEFYFRVKLVPVIFDDSTEGIMSIFENVSDHRRTEMALAEREQEYRTVLENIQDVFYRSDKDGNLIMASPSWASMLGYDSLDECLGKNIADTFYWEPEKRKLFRKTVNTKGRVNDYEVVLKTKKGKPFYVSTNSHLYFDKSGTVLGIEGIFRDVNERHASAEKIQRHVDQMEFFSRVLQEFIELPPNADIFEKIASDMKLLVADAMISVSSYNNVNGTLSCKSCLGEDERAACTRCIGRDPGEIIFPINPLALNTLRTGRLHRIPFSLFEVLFGEISKETCDQICRTLNLGDIYCIGFVRNEMLLGDAVLFLRKDAGCPDMQLIETYARAASISLQRKIAEESLRESQEIFQGVAQESPFPLAIIDASENFRYINRSFSRLFGYDLEDFRSCRQWFLLMFPEPEYRKHAIELWTSDIAAFSEQGTVPREFAVRCKDGTIKAVIFRAMLLSNNEKCIICEDITEIRESENIKQLLSCIVESSNDAIIGKKIDGTVISWNSAAEEMYGYTTGEILGKNISLIVPYERRQELEDILQQVARGHGVSNLETRRIKKDGTLIDISVTISPIIDETGSVIGASTISHDITDRISEKLLRESEDKYRILVETLHIGVYRSTGDPRGRFIWGNTSLVRILGFPSLEKLKEIDVADIFAESEGRKKLLDELQSTGFVKNKEITLRRPDGNTLTVSVTALAKFDKSGQIEFINGIVEDITEQKQISSQLQNLRDQLADIIEFLPDPTFVVNQEHQVTAWNSAIELMTGVGKNEILGHTEFFPAFPFFDASQPVLLDLIDASDEMIAANHPHINRTGTSLNAELFIPSLYSGQGAYLRVRASPLHDNEGRRIGAIQTFRDVSEIKELQELLKNAQSGFVSDALMKHPMPVASDPASPLHDEAKNPGILSLLYLSNALKMAQDSISILDLSGRCIWVNDSFAHTISLKKDEVPTGKSFARFIAPEDRKTALDCLNDVRKNGSRRITLSLLTPTGRIPAEASLSSINDSDGRILGYMAIIRDGEQYREKLLSKNIFRRDNP